MPTYEYRCPTGHDFDRFCKISESQSSLPCPECGAPAERRISGGAGLHFKGSGFYITDYGKDGKKDQKAAAKPAEGATSGGESKGGESKPAAAPAAAASSPPASKPASGGE
ncbi:MAG: FmdB family zinc ribbon protein [Gemmatimonadaceae bacterium]